MFDAHDLGPRLADDYFGTLTHALRLVNPKLYGLEFGVASGKTLQMITDVMPAIGFDSFDGLPEDWRPGFEVGRFAQAIPKVYGAVIVIGLFDDVLPQWIDNNQSIVDNIGLIHVDCDLYNSTTTILRELGDHITTGTIMVFDEYHGYPGWEDHEFKAWQEFVMTKHIQYEPIGHGPEQFALRIL